MLKWNKKMNGFTNLFKFFNKISHLNQFPILLTHVSYQDDTFLNWRKQELLF